MAKIILVTGGSRSGKSLYTQQRAEKIAGIKLFIATCPKIDTEMEQRIAKHREDRRGKGWKTLEEEIDLGGAIEKSHDADAILVDCLTLWINNLMYRAEGKNSIDEEVIGTLCDQLIIQSKRHPGTLFFVTNEVGSGIVPESPEARLYRDLVGRCNQLVAKAADEVILVSCGIALPLKN